MFKFNNRIVPNKMRIGWHFSSNKYAYRDAYSALNSNHILYSLNGKLIRLSLHFYSCVYGNYFLSAW